MGIWRKTAILAVALLAFGAARMPYEASLQRELHAARLFPQKLEIGTWDHVDQTRAAVMLGGLRTLVATFLNLRAFTFFTEQRWDRLAETFDAIVDLAPRTRYYWETGSWHLAYNAASYYLNDSTLPPLRRREAWRSSILAGRAFLERGIRNNPDDWSLHANLGFLLSDPNKFPAFRDADEAFAAAAEAYRKSAETGQALDYVRRSRFYSLARVHGREREALALARSLYAEGIRNHTPTLLALLLVLEAYENPSLDVAARAVELFGTPEKAYDVLSTHWLRTRERFPVFGLAAGLQALERQLAVPQEKSIFRQPLRAPLDPDEMFQIR
jgi:hypothetical protein